ncbi:MAG: type II secretion system F family protein [Candidatus Micrarchaeia archaeon]
MIFSLETSKRIGKPFRRIGGIILSIFPAVKYDLISINADIDPSEYAFAALISALIWGAVFSLVTYVVLEYRGVPEEHRSIFSIAAFIFFLAFAFTLHMLYPGILAKKFAEKTDRELIFALRDMLAQIKSGMPFHVALLNIAKSDYGNVSRELAIAVRSISAGESEKKALERVLMSTKSEYLKRTLWQVLVALESGASMSGALRSALDILMNYQMQSIKNYASELNFAILFYMFFAAVLPSIGMTLLTLLISFTAINVTEDLFYALLIVSVFVQLAIIGYIKNERPVIY